jgi:hypothetical protein
MTRVTLSTLVALGALGISAAVAAPASDQPPKVRNPRLEVQWANPDIHPAPFDRVMLAPIELEFRPVEPMAGPVGTSSTRTEFPVPEQSRERIARDFDEIFREELADNRRYTLTDRPGPGVLLVRPALRDIVSRVPPEEPIGASKVYVDTVGEATLVVDFIDAATGQVLGAAADRRTAEPAGSIGTFGAVRANSVGTGFEVRRLAHRWATSLESRIEQLYFDAKPR